MSRIIRIIIVTLFASAVVACGSPQVPAGGTGQAGQAPAETPATTPEQGDPARAPQAADQTPVDTAADPPTATSEERAPAGELRIGTSINMPTSLLVTKGSNGYNLVMYSAGETLMRFTEEQQVVPWLAESVSRIDPTTWQVRLRRGVTFHDGSEMQASDVAASLRSSWDNLAAAASFLARETRVDVVDDLTLNLVTPQPEGNVPYSLANWNFVIHKAPVNDISILTGMYRPIRLQKDQELVLENFPDYWDGAPPLQRLIVRKIPDANARSLALQSGDLDMLTNVPPDLARGLPADIEQVSVPGTRMHYMILNHHRTPFDDRRVREAVASGIDRNALLQAALDGQGAVATNMYPPTVGIEVVPAQELDVEKAARSLDEAGWRMGADGIREKDGQPLQVTLYSYPGRAEMTPMAVAIQAQLGELGFQIQVEEVADAVETIKDGDFQASMFSVGVSSDPQYMPGISLIKGAAYNYGGYENPNLDSLFTQLRAESDPDKQQALARQLQEVVRDDTPYVFLVVPPLITAFRQGTISGYTPHPNDLYLVTKELTIK